MYQFPEGLYTEVTVKKVTSTTVVVGKGEEADRNICTESNAHIRIFDGTTWQERVISDVRKIEKEIFDMSRRLTPNFMELEHSNDAEIQKKQGRCLAYGNTNISHVPIQMKENLARAHYQSGLKVQGISVQSGFYQDSYLTCTIQSSAGADYIYDEQSVKAGYTYKNKVSNQQDKEETILTKLCEGHYFEDAIPDKFLTR